MYPSIVYTFSTCNQSSLTFTFLELLSEIFSVLTVRRKPSWNMEANKLRLMNHLVEMRKSLVADRVKDKQDMAYVEEKGREILTLRRRGNRVIMSGDNIRLRKVQNADPIITDYLRSLFGEEDDGNELKFETDEDTENPNKFIPKLFCQVGDKKNGWHSKTVERYATLLLTILSGGQGGKLSINEKSASKPAWFCGNSSTQHLQILKLILMLSWGSSSTLILKRRVQKKITVLFANNSQQERGGSFKS